MQIFGFHFGNVKAISMSNLCILLKRCWICISLLCMCRDQYIIKKLSTYRELHTPGPRDLNMELIFVHNMVTELMLPRGNLFSWFWRPGNIFLYGFEIFCLLCPVHAGLSTYHISMNCRTPLVSKKNLPSDVSS